MFQTRTGPRIVYCSMGGECVDIGHDIYECVCRPGFSGPFCEAFSCKSDAACNKRGQCNLDDSHTYHGHCNCFHGYSGRDCHYDTCARSATNLSNRYLCHAGGECVLVRGSPDRFGQLFACECRKGFVGDACEEFSCGTDGDCSNDGTCSLSTGNCECKHPSFSGPDCGIARCGMWNGTEANLCSGHGNCIERHNYMCVCEENYVGDDCYSPRCTKDTDCLNGGKCVKDDMEKNVCICKAAYEGALCDLCLYPNSQQPAGPFDQSTICVPDDCMQGGYVCNGVGRCTVTENGSLGCECLASIEVDGVCIPNNPDLNKCVIEGDEWVHTLCNNRGDCRYGMDKLWRCRCHFGSVRAKDGNCYAIGCVRNGVVCSGRGACMLNTMTGSYSCQCDGSYTGNGATCALKSGIVAVSVIIPLLVIGGVAGFLCWWFLCHKKGRGISIGRGGGSKPRRGKAVRLSDGDSLSVQSGISGFTSQL